MSSTSAVEVGRRDLGGRQADRVEALVLATVEELRAHGYEGLTVRNAARRAGVAPATAYSYFGSKDHLVAEVFWRRLDALPAPEVDLERSPIERVAVVLRELALLVADEPELAAASTSAILARDADVQRLRDRIGEAFSSRLQAALGPHHDRAVLRALNLAFSGAFLQAGMGYFSYAELADRMREVATVVLGERT